MNGHPKWCALSADHRSDSIHRSITVVAGGVKVLLVQIEKDAAPRLGVALDGCDMYAALTLDQAQMLSAGLISLLMRTDAA